MYNENVNDIFIRLVVLYRSDEIKRIDRNYLNCSNPSYNQVSVIFECNMLQECYLGEDELDCDYKTEECGQHAIDLGTNK